MIVDQSIITGETYYDVNPEKSLVTFDVQNDSPYNVGVSLTGEVGFMNCEYHCPAEGLIAGMTPQGLQFAIGGETFGGTIWVYTQVPLGGTIPTNPPASQITIMGYPQGGAPSSTSSMSRLTNTGNAVSTNVSGASLLQNDGNPVSTPIIETTVSGQSTSNITATNDGALNWRALIAGVMIEAIQIALTGNLIQIAAAGQNTEIVGNAIVDGLLTALASINLTGNLNLENGSETGVVYNDATHLSFTPPTTGGFQFNKAGGSGNGQSIFFDEVNGLSITSALPLKFAHYAGESISAIKNFSGTGSGTFSHGLGIQPTTSFTQTNVTGGGSQTMGASSYGASTVVITAGAGLAWLGMSWHT